MEKYLKAVEPLVNGSQLENTRAIVRDFTSSAGMGRKLQELLLKRQEEKDNWAYEWWLNDMYLNVRLPLPINSNPGMVFPPIQVKETKDLARYAAKLIDGVVSHKELLDRRGLPQEKATSHEKGQPLCMAQFYRILTSYRVPGVQRDQLFSTLYQDGSTEHIIIMHRNQMYCLLIKNLHVDGTSLRLSVDQITEEILKILDSPRTLLSPPVGILTAERRDKWAEARDLLRQDVQNSDNLELIEKSLMIVCFDEPLPESFNMVKPKPYKDFKEVEGHKCGSRDETNMMLQMLHGGGSGYNSCNRWFDKTIQLVISKDGVSGLCYEHSPAEGIPVIQLIEKLISQEESKSEKDVPERVPESMEAQKLEWILGRDLERMIKEAAKCTDCAVDDLDFFVYRYGSYGREQIKQLKCSPDAYIQMALQLTYFNLYGHLVATYESAGARRFLLGRVDCIRSATKEALDWAKAMKELQEQDDRKKVSFIELDKTKCLELFDAAMAQQIKIMTDNITGQGIDIHLLGLREAARELTGGVPAIFLDETYTTANHFSLSTSQLLTKADMFMGYGPVVPDGYGVSYNPRPDHITFCISAWHSCAKTSSWRFAQALAEALDSMKDLLSSRISTN